MVIRVTIAYDRAKSVVSPFTGEIFIKQIDFFAAGSTRSALDTVIESMIVLINGGVL